MKCFGKPKNPTLVIGLTVGLAVAGFLTWRDNSLPRVEAQVQNTLYQALVTNSSVTGLVTFGPIRNIGQSFHQVLLIMSIGGGGGCVPTLSDLTVTIVGSNANTYAATGKINFGVPVNNLLNNVTATYQGVGAYPFIYVTVNSSALGGCVYSLLYSGTIQPIPPTNVQLPNILNALVGSATLATGTNTFFSATPGSFGQFRLYQAAIASDVATRVTLTCVVNMNTLIVDIPTSGNMVLPYTGISYFSCPAGSNINSTVAAMTNVFMTSQSIIQRE